MFPSVNEILDTAHVVSLPMTSRFRGIDQREALLFRGPQGWSEFSPFAEYDDAEATPWLLAAIERAAARRARSCLGQCHSACRAR